MTKEELQTGNADCVGCGCGGDGCEASEMDRLRAERMGWPYNGAIGKAAHEITAALQDTEVLPQYASRAAIV